MIEKFKIGDLARVNIHFEECIGQMVKITKIV